MGKIATPQLNGSIVKANPDGNAQEELGKIFIDGRIYSIPGGQGSAGVEAIQAEIDRNVRTDWVFVNFLTSQNDETASNLYSCNIRFYLSKRWLNASIAEQLSQYGITNIAGLCAAWESNFRNGIGYSLLVATVHAALLGNGFKVAILIEYPPTEGLVGTPYVNGTYIFSPDGNPIQSYANSLSGNDIESFMANSTLMYTDTWLND